MALYDYDAWGKITAITGNTGIANANPLRYRGYVYDAETGLYYCGSRYYDPVVGRWIGADSIVSGIDGNHLGKNLFAYCNNNPVNKSDPNGHKPGDLFESEDEAAKEFGNYTNGKSIEDNREYASYIYKVFTITHSSVTIPKTPWYLLALGIKKTPIFNMTVKTQFSYIPPQKGGKSNVIGSVIWFALRPKVAMLHTRAAYDSKYGNDIFSPQDKGLADLYKVPFYVATPLGTLRKYDPADGSDIELFNDLPFDQNHPDRK